MKRPPIVSEGAIKKVLGVPDAARQAVRRNLPVGYDEPGCSSALARRSGGWFLKKGGGSLVEENPAPPAF